MFKTSDLLQVNPPAHPKRHRTSRVYRAALLETLEPRTLLTATIAVAGNGTFITNNDITPSMADFTDYGPMTLTPSAVLGTQVRAFFITNQGDGTLHLTGGTKLVQITGLNATDFKVISSPATSVVGTTNTFFAIQFVPHGAGVRSAHVTIPSDDPNVPSFTFKIQGTGVKTTTLSGGLQVATITQGTGFGAPAGGDITVDYTGYLFNGQVFDTSLQAGRTPFEVNPLGSQNSGVIQGWYDGLIGIKKDEVRMLFIPSSLAYGNNNTSNQLNGLPLIFNVDAKTVAFPNVQITGNGNVIALGDTTPSATDLTILPNNTAGTPTTSTFHLLNTGGGTLEGGSTGLPVFSFSGPNAGNFKFANVNQVGANDYTFDIQFQPTTFGTSHAVAHIRVNDPAHPDYTFAVKGTTTKLFVDLAANAIAVANLPNSIVSGDGNVYTAQVNVANVGDTAVPTNVAALKYQIYLHPTGGGSDILLPSSPGTSTVISGTPVNGNKTSIIQFGIPKTVPTGSYNIELKINSNGAIVEPNAANDVHFGRQTLHVTQGFYNINGTIGSSTLPTSIANSTHFGGSVTVAVESVSNLTLPAGQSVTIQIVAHNTGDSTDTVLGQGVLSISGWTPGHKAALTVSAKALSGLPAGSYQIEAKLVPSPTLTESSTADNLVTKTKLNAIVPLTVT